MNSRAAQSFKSDKAESSSLTTLKSISHQPLTLLLERSNLIKETAILLMIEWSINDILFECRLREWIRMAPCAEAEVEADDPLWL